MTPLSVRVVRAAELDSCFFAPRASVIERAAVATAVRCRLVSLGAEPVAAAGLIRVDDGRLFMFFDVADGLLNGVGHAKFIVRAAREMLSQVDEAVWTPCHDAKYKSAPKLVALCGFVPTDEMIEDARVWLKSP